MPSVRSRLVAAAIRLTFRIFSRSAQRGELMDDHLGLGLGHHVGHRIGVERVDDDRLGAERPQRAGLGSRAGRADDLVAARHELGNELAADRAGRSGNEDLHDVSVRCARQLFDTAAKPSASALLSAP